MQPTSNNPGIITERLELIACTEALIHAEINDRAQFGVLLNAQVPAGWPPLYNDADSMGWVARYLEKNPDGVGWACWYFVLRNESTGTRTVIGTGGFKGKPEADGTAEVGYSVMEDFQGAGYATEATKGLLSWAFEHPQVTRVIAETYPELTRSIRVMEKNGFKYIGAGSEEGVIRYELLRATFEGR